MDKILFVKYSNDRANQFAICTEIFANGDKKLLKKSDNGERKRTYKKYSIILCTFKKTI